MSEVSVINQAGEGEERLDLPPGFRFHPTNEEVVSHYLAPKALNRSFSCCVVADVDLNKIEPWDLPSKAKMGEKEWYFFCHKDRKYPTGTRTNRATASGYWKATGKDKEIFRGRVLVGMKKTLVFYLGRAPRGNKTPWVMHEFRLEGSLPAGLPHAAKDEWAVCRVFNKDLAAPPAAADPFAFLEDVPPLMDSPFSDDATAGTSTSSGAVAGIMSCGDGGFQVKAEQSQQQPGAQIQQLLEDPYYFSLPAAGGYLHHQAGDQAIRRHCNTGAPGLLLAPSSRGESSLAGADMSARQYLELDEPYNDDDGLPDLSNMWEI